MSGHLFFVLGTPLDAGQAPVGTPDRGCVGRINLSLNLNSLATRFGGAFLDLRSPRKHNLDKLRTAADGLYRDGVCYVWAGCFNSFFRDTAQSFGVSAQPRRSCARCQPACHVSRQLQERPLASGSVPFSNSMPRHGGIRVGATSPYARLEREYRDCWDRRQQHVW